MSELEGEETVARMDAIAKDLQSMRQQVAQMREKMRTSRLEQEKKVGAVLNQTEDEDNKKSLQQNTRYSPIGQTQAGTTTTSSRSGGGYAAGATTRTSASPSHS